jgi:CheY-like chemotaxis protein
LSELPLSGLRILLMEDEALIALDVEQLCRDSGAADVIVVRDLGQVQNACGDDYHAAILDVMLSGNPTTDFARTLSGRGVPFVFATGYADNADFFAEFPDTPVVGKPYVGADLIRALAGAIARKR